MSLVVEKFKFKKENKPRMDKMNLIKRLLSSLFFPLLNYQSFELACLVCLYQWIKPQWLHSRIKSIKLAKLKCVNYILANTGEDFMHELVKYADLIDLYFWRQKSDAVARIVDRHIRLHRSTIIGRDVDEHRLGAQLITQITVDLTGKYASKLNLCYIGLAEEEWLEVSHKVQTNCTNIKEAEIIFEKYPNGSELQMELAIPRLQTTKKLTLVGCINDVVVKRHIVDCNLTLEHLELADCTITGTCLSEAKNLTVLSLYNNLGLNKANILSCLLMNGENMLEFSFDEQGNEIWGRMREITTLLPKVKKLLLGTNIAGLDISIPKTIEELYVKIDNRTEPEVLTEFLDISRNPAKLSKLTIDINDNKTEKQKIRIKRLRNKGVSLQINNVGTNLFLDEFTNYY